MSSRSEKVSKSATNNKNLVVVESPAKARTIERILGKEYVVKASMGHVRDLPKKKLGLDVEKSFAPDYVALPDKKKIVKELKSLGEKAPRIYLATDPDREGEAISWHLLKLANWDDRSIHRVVFHEITQHAVLEAFKQSRQIDMRMVNAQQARRILDRLVGYQISPLLWKKVQKGLSAGRVQSVALGMVVQREKEIEAFIPRESWKINATLAKQDNGRSDAQFFVAVLHSEKEGKRKLSLDNQVAADQVLENLKGASYKVDQVKQKETKQYPAPPFTTSTLQQEAWRKLRFSAKRTMVLAQQLYEGLSLDKGDPVGLITYMRTDSVQVASSAVEESRKYIEKHIGLEYLPSKPNTFIRKSKGAQEAHEAIRPTSAFRTTSSMQTSLSRDQFKLYSLIWKRMVASQMKEALSDRTTIEVDAQCLKDSKTYKFQSVGTVLRFPGFRTIYMEDKDDVDTDKSEKSSELNLPVLTKGDHLISKNLEGIQQFTKPPSRYTEATLVRGLEERGIGRPSTYVPIISTIQDRSYVEKEKGFFLPTLLGNTICKLLTDFFPNIMDENFTARMEEELDEIARGDREWVPMLKEFYQDFDQQLKRATEEMPRVKVVENTSEICEQCNKPMVIKTGRFGRFIACSGFPDCRNSKPLLNRVGVECPECNSDLVERRSKSKGKLFFGCSKYPKCKFVVNRRPISTPCPECDSLLITAGKGRASCSNSKVSLEKAEEALKEGKAGPTAEDIAKAELSVTKCQWSGEVPTGEPEMVKD